MASLLTSKQISSLMKVKRKQLAEAAVGLGSEVIVPATATSRSVTRHRDTTVLVFSIQSLPNRAALSARKVFHDSSLKLKKVPNGVVKAAARSTPFVYMMSGPTMIATPLAGSKKFTFPEIIDVAKSLKSNPKLKGLLFTGLVHQNIFLTPKRLEEIDLEESKKTPSAIMQPAMRILTTIQQVQMPILGAVMAWNQKRTTVGASGAINAMTQ